MENEMNQNVNPVAQDGDMPADDAEMVTPESQEVASDDAAAEEGEEGMGEEETSEEGSQDSN